MRTVSNWHCQYRSRHFCKSSLPSKLFSFTPFTWKWRTRCAYSSSILFYAKLKQERINRWCCASVGVYASAWCLCFSLGHRSDDVRIARVCDGKSADSKVLSTSGPELNVVSSIVVNTGLGQHGIVLNLRLPAMSNKWI